MDIEEIKKLPTILEIGENKKRYNDNNFRSYYIVKKIKELIINETDPKIILEVINKLEKSTPVIKIFND